MPEDWLGTDWELVLEIVSKQRVEPGIAIVMGLRNRNVRPTTTFCWLFNEPSEVSLFVTECLSMSKSNTLELVLEMSRDLNCNFSSLIVE